MSFMHDGKEPAKIASLPWVIINFSFALGNILPKAKERAKKPMNRINMDLVSTSVLSLEGHIYALVITDCCTGYRCLYGIRTKDEVWKAVQKWYSDVAELRDMHKMPEEFKTIIAPHMSNGRMDNQYRLSILS